MIEQTRLRSSLKDAFDVKGTSLESTILSSFILSFLEESDKITMSLEEKKRRVGSSYKKLCNRLCSIEKAYDIIRGEQRPRCPST